MNRCLRIMEFQTQRCIDICVDAHAGTFSTTFILFGFSVLTDDKNKFHLAMDLPSDGMIIIHLVYDYCGD